jgi:hypothetical protein
MKQPRRGHRGQFLPGASGNPGGIAKKIEPGPNLADLIRAEIDPRRVLAQLKKLAWRGDRYALEILVTHLAGQPPKTPPQSQTPPSQASLKNLTLNELQNLHALIELGKGNPAPMAAFLKQEEQLKERNSDRNIYRDTDDTDTDRVN